MGRIAYWSAPRAQPRHGRCATVSTVTLLELKPLWYVQVEAPAPRPHLAPPPPPLAAERVMSASGWKADAEVERLLDQNPRTLAHGFSSPASEISLYREEGLPNPFSPLRPSRLIWGEFCTTFHIVH